MYALTLELSSLRWLGGTVLLFAQDWFMFIWKNWKWFSRRFTTARLTPHEQLSSFRPPAPAYGIFLISHSRRGADAVLVVTRNHLLYHCLNMTLPNLDRHHQLLEIVT
jgi:hypothetical protein